MAAAYCSAGDFPPYDCKDFIPGVTGKATGFFHVEKAPDGKWWGIDPLGRGFYFKGVQSVRVNGCTNFLLNRRPYMDHCLAVWGTAAAWETNCIERLQSWGFNMLGQGCDASLEHRGLVHARTLDFGYAFSKDRDPDCAIADPGGQDNAGSAFPNVFNPRFEAFCRERAQKLCAPFADDPWLVGWYLDNELKWWGKRGTKPRYAGLYEIVRDLPPNHSARKAQDAFLAERGATARNAPDALKRDFLLLVAERYFSAIAGAVRAADPNHMILGNRFAGVDGGAHRDVFDICGKYVDVITFNCYPTLDLDTRRAIVHRESYNTLEEDFADVYAHAGRPLMVTEWGFMAIDSGLPCSWGAGQRFLNQTDRARASVIYARKMLSMPHVVGWNFFRWVDQEPCGGGVYSREDSNYGLVNNRDEAYPVAEALARLQNDVVKWRNAQPPEILHAPEEEGPEALVAAMKPPRSVSFAQNGDGFSVECGGRFSCAGGRGTRKDVFKMHLEDQDAGVVSAMVAFFDEEGTPKWHALDEVRSFSWENLKDGSGRLAAMLAFHAQGGREIALDMRYTFFPGKSSVLCEIASVRNESAKDIKIRTVYVNPYPSEMPGIRAYMTKMDMLWGQPPRTAWIYPDGRTLGATTRIRHLSTFRFMIDGAGVKRADLGFSAAAFNGGVEDETGTVLAAGQAWTPKVAPWTMVRATTFGEGVSIPPPHLTVDERIRIDRDRKAKKPTSD